MTLPTNEPGATGGHEPLSEEVLTHLAAEKAAPASLAVIRGMAFGLTGGIAGSLVAFASDSLPIGASVHEVVIFALPPLMALAGFFMGHSAGDRTRRIAGLATGAVVGALAGYALERVEGLLACVPAGLLAAGTLLAALERGLRRIPPTWRLFFIWCGWAGGLASALMAGVLQLTDGRVAGDDAPFLLAAAAFGCLLSQQHDWMRDPDISLANLAWRGASAGRTLLHRQISPFVLALVVASMAGGPAGQYFASEGESPVVITTTPASFAWPLAFGVAAAAGGLLAGRAATGYRTVMAGVVLLCLYLVLDFQLSYVSLGESTIELRDSLRPARTFDRSSVTRVTYTRRSGNRTVSYDPEIHLRDGASIQLTSGPLAGRAVEWMRERWGVEEVSWWLMAPRAP